MFRNPPRNEEDREGEKRVAEKHEGWMLRGVPLQSKWKDKELSSSTQSRIMGFPGKCPLCTTAGKQALNLFPSTPGKQGLPVPLQARLSMGQPPVKPPFAPGRATDAKRMYQPSGKGLVEQADPTNRPGPCVP